MAFCSIRVLACKILGSVRPMPRILSARYAPREDTTLPIAHGMAGPLDASAFYVTSQDRVTGQSH